MHPAFEPLEESSLHLVCSICLDIWTSPRELPCEHVFCEKCIKTHIKGPSRMIQCPVCKRDFKPSKPPQLPPPPSRILVTLAEEAKIRCAQCRWEGTWKSNGSHTVCRAPLSASVPRQLTVAASTSSPPSLELCPPRKTVSKTAANAGLHNGEDHGGVSPIYLHLEVSGNTVSQTAASSAFPQSGLHSSSSSSSSGAVRSGGPRSSPLLARSPPSPLLRGNTGSGAASLTPTLSELLKTSSSEGHDNVSHSLGSDSLDVNLGLPPSAANGAVRQSGLHSSSSSSSCSGAVDGVASNPATSDVGRVDGKNLLPKAKRRSDADTLSLEE